MINLTVNGTSEPVTEQAPTSTATTTTPAPTASQTEQTVSTINTVSPASKTATGQAIQTALTVATLPRGYLSDGSILDSDGVMRSEYVGEYARELAQSLKPLSVTIFQREFLSKAKEANKKKVPYSAKKNCALGMVIQAQKLTHRKTDPAPAVLLDMITAATATVTNPMTFEALYMHLDAVYSFMMCG